MSANGVIQSNHQLNREYPYFKATKPDGLQYTIEFENLINLDSPEASISMGRMENNHIILPDPHKTISRNHCSIHFSHNRWWIVDEGSSNGTFLQREIEQPEIDVRSEDKIALRSGDLILILGKLTPSGEPVFWKIEFIDPGETVQVLGMENVHHIEYSLSQKTLIRYIARRRDVISLGEHAHSLIDYMSRKNIENNNQATTCEHDELIKAVWNNNSFGRHKGNINHLVWQIREKIELDSGEPQFLKTVRGLGYRLEIKVID